MGYSRRGMGLSSSVKEINKSANIYSFDVAFE